MSDTARRWFSIDGLLALLLIGNWLWFALVLFMSVRHFLIPEPWPMAGGSVETETSAGNESALSQFRISPGESAPPMNDNPVLFLLVLSLLLASALVTLADLSRRRGRIPLALLAYGACAMAGMGFVGIQLYRFAEPAFASAGSFHTFLLWERAESLSLNLIAGLALLILASMVMLMRGSGEKPSLAEQATAWHWHALDTFWLIIVALAWHWGVMEGL